jgi:3-oxoacyl-[acyl-carrier-protein] synthase I
MSNTTSTDGAPIHLAVTGLGMVSSLGLDVVTSCAAARAGIMRITEVKTLNVALSPGFGRETPDGMPTLSGHAVPEVGHGYTGVAKVLALATAALQDLLGKHPLSAEELERTAICLNLSDRLLEEEAAEHDELYDAMHERRPFSAWQEAVKPLLGKLLRRSRLEIPPSRQLLLFGGHAGWCSLLRLVSEQLQQGRWDRCLVGGVDSCLESDFLSIADRLGVLKTDEQPAGFLPGEAAAFCLLERDSDIPPPRRSQVIARITGIGQAVEVADQFSEQPPLGRGREQAIRHALASHRNSTSETKSSSTVAPNSGATSKTGVDWALVDLNGLERRALDWGHAAVRLAPLLPENAPMWIPAISFGEIGAATGPVSLCLVGRAYARGYAPGKRALIALASHGPQRAAVVVEGGSH